MVLRSALGRLLNLARLKGMSLYHKSAGMSASGAVTQFSFIDSVSPLMLTEESSCTGSVCLGFFTL